MRIGDQKALVTGGTSGIGMELVDVLVARGCQVVTCGTNPDRVEALRARWPSVLVRRVDVTDHDEVNELMESIESSLGGLDLVFNNAGIQHEADIMVRGIDWDAVQREVDVNLIAPLRVTVAALPLLLQSPRAVVVNVTSSLAIVPKRSAPVYCATKAGLRSLTQALRYQLESTPVKVVEVAPPLVRTGMTEGRESSMMSARDFVRATLAGIERGRDEIWVGQAKGLYWLNRFAPSLAARLVKNG